MRNVLVIGGLALGAVAFALSGCAGEEPVQPQAPPDTNQVAQAKGAYPDGPYGTGKGSTLPDYEFIGYVNSVLNNSTMQLIKFSDFYNPHGRDPSYQPASPEEDDRLFPPGSQYNIGGVQRAKPTVVALDVSAAWCGPCKAYAKDVMPGLWAKYSPCNGWMLMALIDGPDGNVPPTIKNLFTWTKNYKEEFPALLDVKGDLAALFKEDAYPSSMMIDTTNMKLVQAVVGEPSPTFWAAYEKLLADPSCPQ